MPEMLYTVTVVGHDDYDLFAALEKIMQHWKETNGPPPVLRFENDGDPVVAAVQAISLTED